MVKSLRKAIDMMILLGGGKKDYSLSELAAGAGLPPSTAHRILQTLCSRQMVMLNAQTHMYRLGPTLISLGMSVMRNIEIRETARPILKKLAMLTGEDSMLMVLAGYKGVIVEKVEGPSCIKVIEKHGQDFDLHCGGNHKVLLAFSSEDFIEEYIAHGLLCYTEKTIADPDVLRQELAQIREQGVGISHGEYMENVVGIGAPVFDYAGKIIASVGTISPLINHAQGHTEFCVEQVKIHARMLSKVMGGESLETIPR